MIGNQIFFLGYNALVNPLLQIACGGSKTKEFLAKSAIIGVSFGLATITGSYLSYRLATIAFGSTIANYFGSCIDSCKTFAADSLDKYDLDYLVDYLDPFFDIAACAGLRKLAGYTISISFPKGGVVNQSPVISLENSTNFKFITLEKTEKSFLEKISSGIMSILSMGESSQNNQGNFVSNGLNLVANNFTLLTVQKSFNAISDWSRQDEGKLSVYDIKSIIKAQGGDYNRAEAKAQAEQIYAKIEQSNQYYEKSKVYYVKQCIYIVTELYSKNFGRALKEQYGSALSNNPELLAKAHYLVDELMQVEVTSRLLNAREASGKIMQFQQYGISVPEEMRGFIKNAAEQKLTQEADSLNATDKEKLAYKSLFSKAAEIEIEYAQLSYIFMAMQQQEESGFEFANA